MGERRVLKSPAPVQPKQPEKGMVHGIAPGRAGTARAEAQALSAAAGPDLAGARRCRRLAAARPRGVEIPLGRSLPGHGPGTGRGRARGRLDQGAGAFPDVARRLFPRHGRQSTSPASFTSSAPCGPCAAPSSRNVRRSRDAAAKAPGVERSASLTATPISRPEQDLLAYVTGDVSRASSRFSASIARSNVSPRTHFSRSAMA